MDDWVAWMIAAGVLAVGEIVSLSFFLGRSRSRRRSLRSRRRSGPALAIQLLVFILASAASLLVLRPVARRHLRTPAQIRTGTAALVGERAVVLERVDSYGGQIKLGGEVWTARTYDEDEVIEPGQRVQVLQIRGATALVSND